jgi:broad specificity phosphatase PhoE
MNKTHLVTSMNKLKPILVALLIATVFTGITVVASSAENKNMDEHLFKVLGWLEGRGYTTNVADHHAKLYSEGSKCSMPTKIVLIRHGETSWNALGILQGNANVPLNENGSTQAQALANSTYNKTVNAVYSSPLSRAYDTAQGIADMHHLPVKVRGNLREIGVGTYTGYTSSQIPSEIRISWSTNPYFAMPSGVPNTTNLLDPSYVEGIDFKGESLDMASDRSWHSITDIAKQHCGENVVTVTHGGIIQMALTKVKCLNITEYKNIPVPTASQTVLEFEPNNSVVLLPNW